MAFKEPAFTSKKITDINSQLSDVAVNVKTFGAKGDGTTDDTTAIQNAVNYVYDNGGGDVIIPRGTFIFTSICLKTNVRLKGAGGVLKLKNNTCVNGSTSYYLIHNLNGSSFYNNVTIDGIEINGNMANNTSFVVADGITLGGENCHVRNAFIHDVPDSGIMFSGVTNGSCANNRIHNGRDLGIYINDGDGTKLYESIISQNKITNFPFGGIAAKRISQRIIISENFIYNCGNGITLEQASTSTDYSKNISIVNNRLRYIGYIEPSAAKVGINIRSSNYSLVSNNRLEDIQNRCILIEGSSYCNVIDNIITCETTASTSNNDGVYMTNRDSNGCNFNNITGNIITNPQHRGIWLTGSIASNNNNISKNIVTRVANGDALRIEAQWINNTISENVLDGLFDIEYFAGAQNRMFNNRYINSAYAGNIGDYNATRFLLGKYCLWIDSTGNLRIKNSTPSSDTDGNIFIVPTQSSSSPAIITGGTIATANLSVSRTSPASAVTNCILQSGTYGGQEITVINESTSANSITFNATGSNVADGSNDVISGNTARKFVWDSGTSLWYRTQ